METQWLAFSVAALMLTLMPGPDTFLVMGNAVAGGARRGLAAAAGTTSGGLFHVALFALGVTQLLMYSERAFWTVKMLGAFYLAFLGIKALRAALRPRADAPAPALELELAPPASSLWRAFAQGALTNALNPKIAMFYLAFLPQFLAPGPHMARDSMLMIGLHYAIGAVWLAIVAVGSARMAGAMRSARVARALDGVIGTMMLGFGARLALASR
ncbi:LysE family translocator [Lysobacter enzymogenes]|uniref:LysE family translocator n=1 Tax=Lysobacter enzymogenes TaxID=69 RepID=UPI001AF2E510|nr:LysE family translocator [Lysobacter enzymogenes]QQQ00305.1 LysE family translocator [Lysobacter enzymogenes]